MKSFLIRKIILEIKHYILQIQVHTPDQAASIIEPIRHERDMSLPLPFEELMHENETAMDENNGDACLPDSTENENECKAFLLPDAHALLHVTSRRKMHVKVDGSFLVSLPFHYFPPFDLEV